MRSNAFVNFEVSEIDRLNRIDRKYLFLFFVVLRLAADLNVNLSAMYLLQFAITGLTICGSEFRLTTVKCYSKSHLRNTILFSNFDFNIYSN